MRIPQSVKELAYEQLKARAGTRIYSNAEFKGKDLTIVSGIHGQISKRLLTKSVDVTFQYLRNTTLNKFNFGVIGLRVYGKTTHNILSN